MNEVDSTNWKRKIISHELYQFEWLLCVHSLRSTTERNVQQTPHLYTKSQTHTHKHAYTNTHKTSITFCCESYPKWGKTSDGNDGSKTAHTKQNVCLIFFYKKKLTQINMLKLKRKNLSCVWNNSHIFTRGAKSQVVSWDERKKNCLQKLTVRTLMITVWLLKTD